MKRVASGVLLCVLAGAAAAPVAAQMSELQFGALVSYGAPRSFHQGGGLVGGIALGRVVYLGARWVYQAGVRERPAGAPADVTTRTQLLTADFGAMLPVAGAELVPGISCGGLRFAQSGPEGSRAWRFALAPGLSLHVHTAGVVAIPELQYVLAGTPRLALPVPHRGPIAALRIAIPVEVRRIRY